MRKIYQIALSFAFAMSLGAQTTIKIKNPIRGENNKNSSSKMLSPMQVAASIVCNTQYVAGSTMDLEFTYTASNTDLEFVDLLTITFPAGITPNSSPNATFPTSNAGGGAEVLNAPVGQVISWGVDNNDGYGGIITTATGVNFTVNVTVAPGTTGNQTANFDASGDGYGSNPGDLIGGSFIIYPAGASVSNLTFDFVQPFNITSFTECNYGVDTLFGQIKNLGTTTESNFVATYMVNGVAQPSTIVPGPLAPGDSTYVFWLPGYDFSATNTYDIKAFTSLSGDINLTNDTATFSFSNQISIPISTTSYTNGIESSQNVADIALSGNAANFTGLSTGTFHSGTQALFTTVNTTTITANQGVYNVFISLPCMDVVSGETYRISYWKKVNSTPATHQGSGGIFTGLSNDGATMTALKPFSPITPTGPGAINWSKDSVDYIAGANETRYFAVAGQGTVSSTSSFNFRVDDIKIEKVISIPTGIKTNTNSSITLFPNPTSGILNINTIETTSLVDIYNVIGDKVLSTTLVKGNNSVDLSNLSNGAYFVKVNSNNQIITKKIILNK